MLVTLLALLHFPTYAASPQLAAIQAVNLGSKKRATVRRINRVGWYAAVLVSDGMMEGSAITEPILVQHFSFGWQPLDLLNFRCRLHSHALSERAEAQLMRGMPKPQDDRPCRDPKDAGPRAEVEAVRELMRGPLVPYVIVSGDWAFGLWYGAGGGDSLFHQRGGHWRLVREGGGAMGVSQLQAFGVPESAWCKFRIYDATCDKHPQ